MRGFVVAVGFCLLAWIEGVAANAEFQPLWTGKHPDASLWSRYVADALKMYGKEMIKGPADVANFCPDYSSLDEENRINFWIQLFAALTKYESGFNPSSRYVETTMGKDPVTGKQVVSEGLLQLSYQDESNYKNRLPAGACDFDYESNSKYPVKDLRRSILNPEKNLGCGVAILAEQVARAKRIVVGRGAYWAVLKSNSRYSKIKEIQAITGALKFCVAAPKIR
jgi:hypothetical protein